MGANDDTNAKLGSIEVYLKRLESCISVKSDVIPISSRPRWHINLSVQPRFDDSLAVSINGGEELILGPRLAGFFLFIASGDAECEVGDELIDWSSRDAILKSLTNFKGKKLRINYVNTLLVF